MVIIQLIDDEGVGTLVTVVETKDERPKLPPPPQSRPPFVEPQVQDHRFCLLSCSRQLLHEESLECKIVRG